MSELKPCPFCDCKAEIDFSSVGDYGNRLHQSGQVECTNKDCCAEIGIYDFDPDDTSIDPSGVLIKKWNTRADSWISVATGKLPQQDFEVIACCDDYVKACIFRLYENGGYDFELVEDSCDTFDATHWMPLPKPPGS